MGRSLLGGPWNPIIWGVLSEEILPLGDTG